jgi:hypothetical protein
MRIGVAMIALLLPAALSAQRIPLGGLGRRGPASPEPIPPQPAPVARDIEYHRLRVAVESYPMVSYFAAPSFATNGRASSWASVGTGTHADYRLTNAMSATLDMTSSFYGGPELVETVELGTRFRPEIKQGARISPYIDARVGYISAYTRGLGDNAFVFNDPFGEFNSTSYSHGWGAMGGAGFDYSLSLRWSLMTGVMLMQSRMIAEDFQAPETRPFTLTSFRYTLGLRFNPVRMISRSKENMK